MADTLKFGPQWYGREEMLALYTPTGSIPEELKEFVPIITEKAQDALALQPLSEEEQRIMSQSVNSQAVLRMMGRGAPPMRGRGGGIDRGRGRGRGRGEGYMQRGMSYEDGESGGFGRARQRADGSWDEVGQKPYQRSFPSRFDEGNGAQKLYQRSFSSDNWRDREEDDEDGDWRKAGSKWSNSRTGWREGGRGFDYDRSVQNNSAPPPKGFSRQYQRSRSSESWEEEMPEWSTDGDLNELGTFDASGVFVPTRPKGRRLEGDKEVPDDNRKNRSHRPGDQASSPNDKPGYKGEETDIRRGNSEKDQNEIETKPTESDNLKTEKTAPQRRSPQPNSNSAQSSDKNNKTSDSKTKTDTAKSKPSPTPSAPSGSPVVNKSKERVEKNGRERPPPKQEVVTNVKKDTSKVPAKSKDQGNDSKPGDTKVPTTTSASAPPSGGHKKREKLKSEAEALDQLQETVENMVAGIALEDEDDDDEREVSVASSSSAPKSPATSQPQDPETFNKWYYRDPQGDLQGPFTSSEMAEWFTAGYFTMNLLVRRVCDEKFSPLGELIKQWGRVPFLPGPTPPPLLNSAHSSPDITQQQQQQQQQQEQLAALQQQILMQQQMIQQQMLMRHMQLQQMQGVMSQLQENEAFKALPPAQQQQFALQILLKQQGGAAPVPPQAQQKLSPRASEASSPPTSTQPPFTRSFSSSAVTSQGQTAATTTTNSIWDMEPGKGPDAALKEQEAERKYHEALERQKEELMKQQEEIQRQKEEIERERMEMERKKQLDRKKREEARRLAEEEEKRALQDKLRREEEQRRQFEEEKRQKEEERRKFEEVVRKQQEMERQKDLQRQQEIQRQQEMQQRQKEEEERLQQETAQQQQEAERLQQQQRQRQQEEVMRSKQQEALRRLQEEQQMANMQLPSHAQWASSGGQPAGGMSPGGKSLLEIQQMEEQERQEMEEMQRKQLEIQRQEALQQQQQQQQKSWTSAMLASAGKSTKSLLEIQEEQARQLERERQKREENQQQAVKNLSLGAATVWGSSPPVTNWANEGAWGALKSTQVNVNNNNNLGFWDDAIISSSGPVNVKPAPQKKGKANPEFPSLSEERSNKPNKPVPQQSKPKQSKAKKTEEAVQRLFQSVKPEDDFTQWCDKQLRNMATSVDIPTFIAFLQEVESPYEVHDYVRSYLGENRASEDFGKAFLEKRSQYRNKSRQVVEDSIWGPAPAITPRELRQPPVSNMDGEQKSSKASKKKKGRMMKVDASILGFTVHAAPDRMVGEIENFETGGAR